ncbi:RNA-directed DNA polymerase from mobile element jockey [Aphis craccivora]|uniref:RNA-directed DNA polymerase from mobile element jockey n=1 Tax=Aphis craccivora TaxID=307492 RepID=A0A6G0Z052_APHCR|nr:RNA-directed DNA polymerase from mobile element jockey [Aphis craccivora]
MKGVEVVNGKEFGFKKVKDPIPSNSIDHLWSVTKKFKNCITPSTQPDNDDWFDDFCSEIAPFYVPSESKFFPRYVQIISPNHTLTNLFNNISPVMLKQLPASVLDLLLSIMNNIYTSQQIPPSWTVYKVIPIAKQNSKTSFRSIGLSSSLCKIFEHMLQSRLDWSLEYNSILPDNLFAFRRGRDIRGAFDSVNIFTLISHLISLHIPQQLCNTLMSLFNKRNLIFSYPFGAYNSRSTYTGLPQGSCLTEFAAKYKHIVLNIPHETLFNNLNLSKSSIVYFNRRRLGRTLLPVHAYKLELNDSPLCTLHTSESPCDLSDILFDCPSLLLKLCSISNKRKK